MYGSVFEWVIIAIWYSLTYVKPELTILKGNSLGLAIANGISMVGIWSALAAEKFYGVTPVNTSLGIFSQLWF